MVALTSTGPFEGGLTSVNVAIRDSPDVNTPFSRVAFEMYTPLMVPLVFVGVDNGAGPTPLSIAKMFPTTLAGFVVEVVELDP
jgi:hypothetical protein